MCQLICVCVFEIVAEFADEAQKHLWLEMTTDIPEDPVEMVMRAIEHYDGLRSRLDPLKDIMDRERLLMAIILGMLSDPNHPVGKYLGRELLAHLPVPTLELGDRAVDLGQHLSPTVQLLSLDLAHDREGAT